MQASGRTSSTAKTLVYMYAAAFEASYPGHSQTTPYLYDCDNCTTSALELQIQNYVTIKSSFIRLPATCMKLCHYDHVAAPVLHSSTHSCSARPCGGSSLPRPRTAKLTKRCVCVCACAGAVCGCVCVRACGCVRTKCAHACLSAA